MTDLPRFLYHHRIRADDGQAVHVREMIGALRAAGHEVVECALVPKATGPAPGPGGAAAPGAAGGSRLWRSLRLPRVATELLEILYDRSGTRRILRTVAGTGRPDVIYERHALHCASGLRAARRLGVPLLLEVNSPMCDEMRTLGLLRFGARADRVERAVLAGADAVLAVSGVLRDRLVELGADPARTHVVRNGADVERHPERSASTRDAARRVLVEEYGLALGEAGFVLGFVGFARPWHRLDLVVDVLARPGFERAHLVVVGEGPALEPLRELARAAGVAARLHLPGAVGGTELARLVGAFDAALIPAINRYASPLKAFDAFAAGVPVVAPRQPNVEELIDDGVDGVLCRPDSADALAGALGDLVRDPERAFAIGAAGRRKLVANGWTWAGQAARVAAIAAAVRGPRHPVA